MGDWAALDEAPAGLQLPQPPVPPEAREISEPPLASAPPSPAPEPAGEEEKALREVCSEQLIVPLFEEGAALLQLVAHLFVCFIITVIRRLWKCYGVRCTRKLKSFKHFLHSSVLSVASGLGGGCGCGAWWSWRRAGARLQEAAARPLARAMVWAARLLGGAALVHAAADVAALAAFGAQGVAALAAALLALWTQEVYAAVTAAGEAPEEDPQCGCSAPSAAAAASDANTALEAPDGAEDPALAPALSLPPKVAPTAAAALEALQLSASKHAVEADSAAGAGGEYSVSCE